MNNSTFGNAAAPPTASHNKNNKYIILIVILCAAGKDIKDVDIFNGKKFKVFAQYIRAACIELLTVA